MNAADVILATLRSALPSDVAVYDAMVPGSPPARYVILFCGNGLRESSSVLGTSADLTQTFQVTSVTSRPDTASTPAPLTRWLQAKVRESLTDKRFDVDGLACGLVRHVQSLPPVVDEDVKDRPTVYAVDQFEFLADWQ
jgi:hypothetical protein